MYPRARSLLVGVRALGVSYVLDGVRGLCVGLSAQLGYCSECAAILFAGDWAGIFGGGWAGVLVIGPSALLYPIGVVVVDLRLGLLLGVNNILYLGVKYIVNKGVNSL